MTDNIISFAAAKEERTPHWEGECVCLGCGHTWRGVGPIGVISNLECSACGLDKGVTKNLFGPPEGAMELQCEPCGCSIFTVYMRKDGTRCVKCLACGNDVTGAFYDG